jgi:hypothetical protein
MARGRSLAEFQRAFPDEASCAAFFFARRWPDHFAFPACGEARAVALKSRPRLLDCLHCGRQTSLTAGTAMHRSKLPLTTWFWAAHLLATHSNGMSARQLAEQLDVTYKTAWLLTQKLRRAMADPNRDLLEGVVEVDQTAIPFRVGDRFFEPGNAKKNPDRRCCRGDRARYPQGQTETARCQVSRYTLRSPAPRRDRRQLGRLDRGLRAGRREIRGMKQGATLITDGHASYPGLAGAHFPDKGGGTIHASSAPWRPMSSCHGATAPSR